MFGFDKLTDTNNESKYDNYANPSLINNSQNNTSVKRILPSTQYNINPLRANSPQKQQYNINNRTYVNPLGINYQQNINKTGRLEINSENVTLDTIIARIVRKQELNNTYYKDIKVVFTSQVKSMSTIDDFNIEGLKKYNISSIDMSSAIKITTIPKQLFKDCPIEEVILPINLKTIEESAFESSKIDYIYIPASVETIETCAFSSSTANINIPKYSCLHSIGECAFSECNNIKEIVLPDTVNEIGAEAFSYCENLEKVTILSDVDTMGSDIFYGCNKLKEIYVTAKTETVGLESGAFNKTEETNENNNSPENFVTNRINRDEVLSSMSLFKESGPSYRDIEQGEKIGDCWLLSILAGIVSSDPKKIKDIVREDRNDPTTVIVKVSEIMKVASKRLKTLFGNKTLEYKVKKIENKNLSKTRGCFWVQAIEQAVAMYLHEHLKYLTDNEIFRFSEEPEDQSSDFAQNILLNIQYCLKNWFPFITKSEFQSNKAWSDKTIIAINGGEYIPYKRNYTKEQLIFYYNIKNTIDNNSFIDICLRTDVKKIENELKNSEVYTEHAYCIIGVGNEDGRLYLKLFNPHGVVRSCVNYFKDQSNNYRFAKNYFLYDNNNLGYTEDDIGIMDMDLNMFFELINRRDISVYLNIDSLDLTNENVIDWEDLERNQSLSVDRDSSLPVTERATHNGRYHSETNIDYSDENIEELRIPDGVHSIGSPFNGRNKIRKIILPSSLEKICDFGFFECQNLENIELADNNCNLKIIGKSAFQNCKKLETLDPRITASLESIGNQAFYDCNSLEFVNALPANSLESIGEDAFYKCSNLRSIDSLITASLKSIGEYSFYECVNLDNVNFKAANSLNYIGEYAFACCRKLRNLGGENGIINLPSNLKYIRDYAFVACDPELYNNEFVLPYSLNKANYETWFYGPNLKSDINERPDGKFSIIIHRKILENNAHN